MQKFWLKCSVFVLGLAFVSCIGFAFFWVPDRSVSDLAVRWASPPSQWITVDGMQVHLRDEGSRTDPEPIVLLHGTSSSLHTWDGWVQHLVPSRRVIRMDLPAFGLTGPHPNNDYAINAYVQFVSSVLKALNVHSFVLAGNSLGGHIAWSYALSKPLEVKKLILVDAAGYAMQSRSVPIAFQLARVPGFSFVLQHVLPRSVVESSLRNVYGNPTKVSEELIDRYYDLALRKGNRSALFKRMQTPAIADSSLIASIKLPVLVLWGGKDQLIPLENAYRFASDIRGATLVVFEGLGHVPHEEDPDLTVKAVQQFLQR